MSECAIPAAADNRYNPAMQAQGLTPEQCAHMIRRAQRTMALCGAGISTAAGIPDFRGPDGLYTSGHYDPYRAFSIEFFRQDPKPFFDFAREAADMIGEVGPTFTHRFLAALESQCMLVAAVTQNIDALHQQAGSRNVVALHGSFATSRCLACGREFGYEAFLERLKREDIPRCDCEAAGVIKPDVVLFGEPVRDLKQAIILAQTCDLMLVLGSSLTVHPAAGLPEMASGNVVVVNAQPVDLEAGPTRHFVLSDLDVYFRQVAACLGITVK